MKLANRVMMFIGLSVFSLASVACSNQWREAEAGVTADELLSLLDEAGAAQSSGLDGTSTASALALLNQPSLRIYFAEAMKANGTGAARSPMGSVPSVLSIPNLAYLGLPNVTWTQIAEVRIFFLDAIVDGVHKDGLIVGLRQDGGNMQYISYTADGVMKDDSFEVNFGGKLVLRSMDVTDGDFDDVIQMQVGVPSSPKEIKIGKFSTLVGFGD